METKCGMPRIKPTEQQRWCPHLGGFGPPFFCPECDGEQRIGVKSTVSDTPDLSLLILDLGDSCVIRVEKGLLPEFLRDRGYHHGAGDETFALYWRPFDQLAAALDGEKPVPRIEKLPNVNYRMCVGKHLHYLSPSEYDALSQLAGHPLPIYSGGKWTQLPSAAEKGIHALKAQEMLPIAIWRYTR